MRLYSPDAYRDGFGRRPDKQELQQGELREADSGIGRQAAPAANTNDQRFSKFITSQEPGDTQERAGKRNLQRVVEWQWDEFPTESSICSSDDGFPGQLDGITFPAWCRESIKAYGNAIVPHVFLQIALAINEYEALTNI